jgi:acyl carrier protein
MVPGIVVPLTTLPRTPNGKIDRRTLPDPFESARAAVAFESPTSNAEEMLAEVWRGVLSVDRVGRQDNFFELGGHSLAALRVVNAIEERTGVRIDPRRLFFQTLAQLAPSLEQLRVAICR